MMQAIPSLVGTGAVVAAAAAGLVFGQPSESDTRPSSNTRNSTSHHGGLPVQPAQLRPSTSAVANAAAQEDFPYGSFRRFNDHAPGPLSSHPTTNFASRPRASTNQAAPRAPAKRQSFAGRPDLASRRLPENRRDSISSRDSWIKRLSIRPQSQHERPESSIGPSSPLTFSRGSGGSILSPIETVAAPLPPNKLVKRATSGQDGSLGGFTGRDSKSHMPSLRRPATSHQRSATLQLLHYQDMSKEPPSRLVPKYSLEQQMSVRGATAATQGQAWANGMQEPEGSTSFFHSKVWRPASRANSGWPVDGSPNSSMLPSKRISLRGHISRVYLTKPSLLTRPQPVAEFAGGPEDNGSSQPGSQEPSDWSNSAETTPSKRPKRSISMHFSSASSWISKTGSIKRSKRGSPEIRSAGRRNVSAPASNVVAVAASETKATVQGNPSSAVEPRQLASEAVPSLQISTRQKRISSSPLPSLHRLSSFNVDIAKLELSSSSLSTTQKAAQDPASDTMSGSNTPSPPSHTRGVSRERAPTFASSDSEARDGICLDDEDTDFKSDTVFDSLRTMASSSRVRAVETPLESMFDESPPSTAGNGKAKRLSIQEILGRSWDGNTKILEEDESLSTPVRAMHLGEPIELDLGHDFEGEPDSEASIREASVSNRDYARLSIDDDDDDDDWARDDEDALSNHLSPPSSVNARRLSPSLRNDLANMSGHNGFDMHRDTLHDRPRSNIFDWSEPSAHQKPDASGHSPRPKTDHGKQEMDFRGGRAATRKGLGAAHVRSQSVPAVPDPADTSKPVTKYGTWGSKPASEDWDDDFDFGAEGGAAVYTTDGKDSATSFSMLVPASIQATQPTVKAHSGQIRELSLLVNDLKRLCRHGRDLDILNGPASSKWKEAKDIIALASPDEEDAHEIVDIVEPSSGFDPAAVDERFLDQGFDVVALEQPQEAWEAAEPEFAKMAVVRERQAVKRRSVFSPEDDIFGGNWPLTDENTRPDRPRTPDQFRNPNRDSAVIATVIEAMQQQRAIPDRVKNPSPTKPFDSKLFFDTNSLLELVKRAGQLRDSLSEQVRRAELLTQSPAGTPRRERHARHNPDGSPAFTRVFTDPASSPPRHVPKSHSNNSVLSKSSIDSPRMQMMTVN